MWIIDQNIDNVDTIKKNTETLIDASIEVCLEINIEKAKYMLLSRHQNADRNHDIKIKCVAVQIFRSNKSTFGLGRN
jgi:hypothetical protein